MIKNQENSIKKVNQTIVYIDGFNLYFGLKSKNWRRYYWLDLQQLATNLLKPAQQLYAIKYFTSIVAVKSNNNKKNRRQVQYLEALATLDKCSIFYGHYLKKFIKCNKCGNVWETFEEKMTDVNIGVEMLNDAYQDCFDTAILISGDSDLAGPIKKIREQFPDKRIVVAFPPNRVSKQLKEISNAYFTIGRKKISESQFSDHVVKKSGFVLTRPNKWR